MIHSFSKWLTNWFIQKADPSFKEKQEIYEYGTECFLTDLIQILCLLLIAWVMNMFLSTFLFSVSFAFVKKNVGGAHANSHFACIFTFSSLCVIANLFVCYMPPSYYFWMILGSSLLSAFLIFFLAPITHVNHPKSQKSQCDARKKCVLIASLIIPMSIVLGFFIGAYFLPVSLGVLGASFTLLFTKGGQRAWKKIQFKK